MENEEAAVEPATDKEPQPPPSQSKLICVGGLDCAQQADFGFTEVVVGRHPAADLELRNPAVSASHAVLRGDARGTGHISDLDSTNGVSLESPPGVPTTRLAPGRSAQFQPEQRIYLPGAVLTWRIIPPVKKPRETDAGPSHLSSHLPPNPPPKYDYQRQPRQLPPPPLDPLELPDLDAKDTIFPTRTLTWATFAVPLLLGAVLAVLVNPYMALFVLMGPAMAVATWLEGRGRSKKDGKRQTKALKLLGEKCEAYFRESAVRELLRCRFEYPDPPAMLSWAEHLSGRLWSVRRSRSPDATASNGFLQLCVGRSSQTWAPPVRLSGKSQASESSVGQNPQAALTEKTAQTTERLRSENSENPAQPKRRLFRRRRTKTKSEQAAAAREEAAKIFAGMGDLPDVPAVMDFANQSVSLAGPEADSVARWLILQAAIRHGPADLKILIVGADESWEWLDWLPHTEFTAGNELRLGDDSALIQKHTWLIFLTAPKQLPALPDGYSALVLSDRAVGSSVNVPSDLSDSSSSVSSTLELLDGQNQSQGRGLINQNQLVWLDGINARIAQQAARRLARLRDPLVASPEQLLPDQVALVELLGFGHNANAEANVQTMRRQWEQSRLTGEVAAPIGLAAGGESDGIVRFDLPTDGPHVLVAGTTGSGKSELLRCIVTSLGANVDPRRLNFVLIDYKGGSAFDACAKLPHVVGLVTDLDEHLGERALTCLHAELAHRERCLRQAGVSEFSQLAYNFGFDDGSPQHPSLARLFVLVDEFASLANELPNFLKSLVGIAQRGRSLGVHLLLATQRPAGVVSAEIRSNANLRIGLRMLDEFDSQDVLGAPDAVRIPPGLAGRALIRAGSESPRVFQVASVSGATKMSTSAAVEILDLCGVGAEARQTQRTDGDLESASAQAPAVENLSDLEQIIQLTQQCWQEQDRGSNQLRCPWPEPLPERIMLRALRELVQSEPPVESPPTDSRAARIPIGLSDIPKEQTQRCFFWHPSESNLFLVGLRDCGTTEVMLSAAVLLAESTPPQQLHLYGFDFGSAELADLSRLPHTGTIAAQTQPETSRRLLDFLFGELARRQSASGRQQPMLVWLVDNLAALLHWLEESRDFQCLEKLNRLVIDGPAWKMAALLTAESPAAIPRRMLSSPNQQLLFFRPDELGFGAASAQGGAKLPKGRAFLAASGLEIQTASLGASGGLAEEVSEIIEMAQTAEGGQLSDLNSGSLPKVVAPIPGRVSFAELTELHPGGMVAVEGGGVSIPVGLGFDRAVAQLGIPTGGHVLVCGRRGSGKSSTLRLMANQLAAAGMQTVALCPEESLLAAESCLIAAASDLGQLWNATLETITPDRPVWLLLDGLPDRRSASMLSQIMEQADENFHVVLAVTVESLGGSLAPSGLVPGDLASGDGASEWLTQVAASQTAVLLQPEPGDFAWLGVPSEQIPEDFAGGKSSASSSVAVHPKGRACLVFSSSAVSCQIALPPDRIQSPTPTTSKL